MRKENKYEIYLNRNAYEVWYEIISYKSCIEKQDEIEESFSKAKTITIENEVLYRAKDLYKWDTIKMRRRESNKVVMAMRLEINGYLRGIARANQLDNPTDYVKELNCKIYLYDTKNNK